MRLVTVRRPFLHQPSCNMSSFYGGSRGGGGGGFDGFGRTPFCFLKFTLKARVMASPTFQILNFLGGACWIPLVLRLRRSQTLLRQITWIRPRVCPGDANYLLGMAYNLRQKSSLPRGTRLPKIGHQRIFTLRMSGVSPNPFSA